MMIKIISIAFVLLLSNICVNANSANIYEYLDQRNRQLHDALLMNEDLRMIPRQYDANGYEYLPVAQPMASEDRSMEDEDDQFDRDWQAYLEHINRAKEARDKQKISEKRENIMESGNSRRDGEEQFENNLSGPHILLGGNDRLWFDKLLQDQASNDEDGSDGASVDRQATENESTQLIKNAGKSDQDLPAYCNPPNPCPIGVDMRHLAAPCDLGIINTKEFNRDWIWQKMLDGECDCDTKHMTKCPPKQATEAAGSNRGQDKQRRQDDDDLTSFEDLDEDKRSNRHMAVVKKDGKANNPYLNGNSKRSIVKKADPLNL